jgi:hypothetical protein
MHRLMDKSHLAIDHIEQFPYVLTHSFSQMELGAGNYIWTHFLKAKDVDTKIF